MKKIIAVTLTVVALLSALTVTVFAEQYEATPKVNFSEDYIVSVFNGALTRRYNTGGWFSDVRASTDISLANDHSGYAHVWIQGLNREIKTGGSSMDGTYGKDCNNVHKLRNRFCSGTRLRHKRIT